MVNEKSIVKRELFWLGHTVKDEHDDACGNCVNQQTKIQEVKTKIPDLEERHGDIYASEHQDLVKQKKIEGMPWSQYCETSKRKDGTEKKKCEEWTGYKPRKLEKLARVRR